MITFVFHNAWNLVLAHARDRRAQCVSDLGNMFQFKRDFEAYFCGKRNPEFTRSLNPALLDFKTWLVQNKNAIPVEDAVQTA